MGKSEMGDRGNKALTLLLTVYEAVLALYAMYHLCLSINHLIAESLIPGF
jgi:hypothetical protein